MYQSEWGAALTDRAVRRFRADSSAKSHFYAYSAAGSEEDLRKAASLTSAGGQGVESDIFRAYMLAFVSDPAGLPAYASLVEKCLGCDRRSLYAHVALMAKFSESMPLGAFPGSVENTYHYSKVGYTYSESTDDRSYKLTVRSGFKDLGLTAYGNCAESGTAQESGRLGILESVGLALSRGGPEVPKEKIIHFTTFHCELPADEKEIIEEISRQQLGGVLPPIARHGWTARQRAGEEIVWELADEPTSPSTSARAPEARPPTQSAKGDNQSNAPGGVKSISRADKVGEIQYLTVRCYNGRSKVVGQRADGRWFDGFYGAMGDRFRHMSIDELGKTICD